MATLSAPRRDEAAFDAPGIDAGRLLDALPHPVLAVRLDGAIADANVAAETFFAMSRESMRQQNLAQLVAPGSPLLDFVEQVKASGAAFNSYRVELSLGKAGGADQLVDIFVTPLPELRGRRRRHAAGALADRENGPPADPSRRRALGRRHGLDAGA